MKFNFCFDRYLVLKLFLDELVCLFYENFNVNFYCLICLLLSLIFVLIVFKWGRGCYICIDEGNFEMKVVGSDFLE